tara:strand:+ start:192 stop:347 length:156 start_codon:yes stop_codon:yes gene_type:complete
MHKIAPFRLKCIFINDYRFLGGVYFPRQLSVPEVLSNSLTAAIEFELKKNY